MTNDERRPTGLLHSADELRQLIRENYFSHTGRNAHVVACELENEVSNVGGFPARK